MLRIFFLLSLLPLLSLCIELDVSSAASIRKAAQIVARNMFKYYTGYRPGDVPGNLPDPYYWWEAGAMFGALVEYWYYTGDAQFNANTTQALLFQVGPNRDYMPPNQTKTLGNDDQAFWALAAMSAAEFKFPNPPAYEPQWLALAQAVFNTQAARWDESSCGGGLKWQIFTFNNGYNYKNTISNGCFFNIAARLAKYTGNKTYAQWAERTWKWTEQVGLMNKDYHFFDGSDDRTKCSVINPIQWTYNAGVFMYGAAAMWNLTRSELWRNRLEGIIKGLNVFFYKDTNIMYEAACEPNAKCDVDQRSFKAYLSRWMASTVKVAPWTADSLIPKIQASARAAARQCTGPPAGDSCGLGWWKDGKYDGSTGVGEQMAALEIIQANLLGTVAGPVTQRSGGTSKGDPGAGGGFSTGSLVFEEITTADRVGAGILTTLLLASILVGAWWMIA